MKTKKMWKLTIFTITLLLSLYIPAIRNRAYAANQVNMFRLYNPNSGEHFYTANEAEKNHLVDVGWNYEYIGWIALETSATPVYRLYNPNSGDHHYTLDVNEKNMLISVGWKDEGIGWYSDDKKRVPVYRQYNPNAETGSHNYTINKAENDQLVALGWREEGVGWYGISSAPVSNFQQLKNYIETDGKTNSDGNKFISEKVDNYKYGIIINDNGDFRFICVDDDSLLEMIIGQNGSTTTTLEYIWVRASTTQVCRGRCEIRIADYHYTDNLEFNFYERYGISEAKCSELANSGVKTAMSLWSNLVMDVGLDNGMEDLGFINYYQP